MASAAACSPLRAAPLPGPAASAEPARLVLRDWRRLDSADLARWEALAGAAGEPNPFFEPWYLLASLRAFDPAGDIALAVMESGDRWLGALPLFRRSRYYGWPVPHWTGWLHANAFLGAPLIAPGHEAEFWRRLLAVVDKASGPALFLHLPALPLAGPAHAALLETAAQEPRPCGLVHREERALLASGLSPEAYLEASLSGKKRKELRRQYARLGELGTLAVSRQTDAEDLAGWTQRFLALEAAGWKGRNGSALACAPETARLFTETLAGAARAGKLERLSLLVDGRPVAMLATFLSPPGAFAYKTAFDESLARFSPGVLLQRENLALLERPDIAWCDSCAGADHPMIDHFWRERRAVGRLSVGIGGTLRRRAFALILAAELRRHPTGIDP